MKKSLTALALAGVMMVSLLALPAGEADATYVGYEVDRTAPQYTVNSTETRIIVYDQGSSVSSGTSVTLKTALTNLKNGSYSGKVLLFEEGLYNVTDMFNSGSKQYIARSSFIIASDNVQVIGSGDRGTVFYTDVCNDKNITVSGGNRDITIQILSESVLLRNITVMPTGYYYPGDAGWPYDEYVFNKSIETYDDMDLINVTITPNVLYNRPVDSSTGSLTSSSFPLSPASMNYAGGITIVRDLGDLRPIDVSVSGLISDGGRLSCFYASGAPDGIEVSISDSVFYVGNQQYSKYVTCTDGVDIDQMVFVDNVTVEVVGNLGSQNNQLASIVKDAPSGSVINVRQSQSISKWFDPNNNRVTYYESSIRDDVTVNIDDGVVVTVQDGIDFTNGGIINVYGTLLIDDGQSLINSSTGIIAVSGSISGSVDNSGSIRIAMGAENNSTVTGDGKVVHEVPPLILDDEEEEYYGTPAETQSSDDTVTVVACAAAAVVAALMAAFLILDRNR